MRIQVNPVKTFSELLKGVRETTLMAFRYQDVPFEQVIERLSPERFLNRLPLVHIMFALQNAPAAYRSFNGLHVEHVVGTEQRVRTDIEVHAYEDDAIIRIDWSYNRDLFDRWRIEQMARHYLRLLEIVTCHSNESLDNIEFLDSQELTSLLDGFCANE